MDDLEAVDAFHDGGGPARILYAFENLLTCLLTCEDTGD